MLRVLAFALLTLALMFDPTLLEAQEPGDILFNEETMLRSRYQGSSDLPDGDAFSAIVESIPQLDESDALALVKQEMGLEENDATIVIDRLRKAREDFAIEFRDLKHAIACTRDTPSKEEVYAMFESLDDVRTTLATQQLVLVKADIGLAHAARLQQWVETAKLQIHQVKYRYQSLYEALGKDPRDKLAVICGEPEG